jgi:hypothetical protein
VALGGYSASDIKQGSLGDCWLLSAMSVIATRPDLMDHVLITKEYMPAGTYACRFHKEGKWRTVVVDDLFPVKRNVYKRRGKRWRGNPSPGEGKYVQPSPTQCSSP